MVIFKPLASLFLFSLSFLCYLLNLMSLNTYYPKLYYLLYNTHNFNFPCCQSLTIIAIVLFSSTIPFFNK